VDAVSISLFKDDEINNLYKLWNRMSAGSYMPGPVRAVEIPKDHGAGVRVLGVPNVAEPNCPDSGCSAAGREAGAYLPPDSYGLPSWAFPPMTRWPWPGNAAGNRTGFLTLISRAFFDSVPMICC